jgi:hypothetical protein
MSVRTPLARERERTARDDLERLGHGYGRLAFEAVLAWAQDSSRAEVADLFATGMGQGMYAAAGFSVHPMPAMRLPLRPS